MGLVLLFLFVLVKNCILNGFDIRVLDNSVEGIICLLFNHKQTSTAFTNCVC